MPSTAPPRYPRRPIRRCSCAPFLSISIQISDDTPMNKLFAVLLILSLGTLPAQAQFVVEVTRGQSEAIPIAIVPFAAPDVAASSFDVAQLVNDDLARSAR